MEMKAEVKEFTYPCWYHETPRTFEWCELNCEGYYHCNTVLAAMDEERELFPEDYGM